MKKIDKKFAIQEARYIFPYHHLVDFEKFSNYKTLSWGLEYYSYMSKVIGIIKQSNFNSLLDVGCGDGKMIFEIMKFSQGKKVVGIDLSEKAIKFAQAFNYKNGAEFYCNELTNIKEKFDIITLIETLEHIPDEQVKKVIDDIYKKLNKSGSLIISVPSTNIPLNVKHYRHYTLDMLLKDFNKFKLKKTHYSIKNNLFYNFIVKISRKFCCFKTIRRILPYLSNKFFPQADKNSCGHLICVFSKS